MIDSYSSIEQEKKESFWAIFSEYRQEQSFGQARLGQTAKIQKYLQTHNADLNTLNLYGESPLSIATYHNQIGCVELLLAKRADPKLRLSAGHTAIHIACQLGNVTIVHMFLSWKNEAEKTDEDKEEVKQQQEEKHMYECLRIKDHADLTPIHWAATQEVVSKRQKMFAYLDQRMPGILDSRYNMEWFHWWAKTHPWVIESKTTKALPIAASVRPLVKLTNTDGSSRHYYQEGFSLPLANCTPFDKNSIHEYERTPRLPLTATTIDCYDDMWVRNPRSPSSKVHRVEQHSPVSNLPVTPLTGTLLFSNNFDRKSEYKQRVRMQTPIHPKSTTTSEKTPYSQRLTSMIKKLAFSPSSDYSTYRAERAHVIPTGHLPPSPIDVEDKEGKGPTEDEMMTPISSKRPSHNLLSNIVPSTSTPSTDQSSRQSSRPFGSFGFDASIHTHAIDERTTPSTTGTSTRHPAESFDDDDEDDRHYSSNRVDYLCESASTLGIPSPGAYHYDR